MAQRRLRTLVKLIAIFRNMSIWVRLACAVVAVGTGIELLNWVSTGTLHLRGYEAPQAFENSPLRYALSAVGYSIVFLCTAPALIALFFKPGRRDYIDGNDID